MAESAWFPFAFLALVAIVALVAHTVGRRLGRPVMGPPLPDIECGHRGWRSWMHCDLPFGHAGQHGTIIGRSTKTGGFVESSSVTREMWT